MIFLECERHKWKCWNIQVRENSMSILRDETLRSFNKFKKMYIPVTVRLILKDKSGKNTVNQFSGSNLWVQIFWKMREFQKKGAVNQKTEASLYTLASIKFNLLFTLYTYAVPNILQNGAKYRYAKAGLKNYRNLKHFRQAVESPKS